MFPTTPPLLLLSLLTSTSLVQATTASWWDPPFRPTPDSSINVTGAPFLGTAPSPCSAHREPVRGFIDAHTHLLSNEGFGGHLLCGKPFFPSGIADALQDCEEHYPDGSLAIFDFLINGGDGRHDPVGWPTFVDWPAHDSVTHQQSYYAWVERSWRAGQRVLVNQVVSNGVLCEVYPFKDDRGCDEMKSVRLQVERSFEMERYIDGIFGGEGKGWFRIVKDSKQAREVIIAGKLAVVLGVEVSEPFGCRQIGDVAQCSEEDIDRGLDELYELGVRSMFLCHKFDNALCGVRFDDGDTGTAVNVGQFLSTGTFWETERCLGVQVDNVIAPSGNVSEFLLGALPEGVELPEYGVGVEGSPQCNVRGLTSLGEYTVRGMMKRKMMVEIDHMSVKATSRVLDILEAERYPGVLSSHSWMDLDWTGRLYKLGGFIAQYMHQSEQFISEAERTAEIRSQYGVGYGFGTDMNGFGSWPAPRNSSLGVKYPYTSVDGGSVIDKLTTGERTWDLNTDGAANYGLVPDWIEDIRVMGGQKVVDDLFRGAESYLGTWGASENHHFTSKARSRFASGSG